MSQYGKLVDGGYDPTYNQLYNAFVEFFNNEHDKEPGGPLFTKIKDITTDNYGNERQLKDQYSYYATKTLCYLSNECRYLCVIVSKDDNDIGEQIRLHNLPWISFQTRVMHSGIQCGSHTYKAKRGGILSMPINRVSIESDGSYIYTSDNLPVKVTLLPKRNNHDPDYNSQGTIIAALETYNTIITIL